MLTFNMLIVSILPPFTLHTWSVGLRGVEAVFKKSQLTQLANLEEESWNMNVGKNGSRQLIFSLQIGKDIEG